MCDLYDIKKTRTTPLHPQSDGMVERFHRTRFGTKIKLSGDLEFNVNPATAWNATYTGKEDSLNGLHEFVRTRIKMVSDRMKARYDSAANTESFHEEEGFIPKATNQLGWTV